MTNLYIGIDNGASGGIAALYEDGRVFRVDPMPLTDPEVFQLLSLLSDPGILPDESFRPFAMLEHAQAFPKMGVSGAFTYGRGYGAMQMALHAASIPFDIVTPRKWQAALGSL